MARKQQGDYCNLLHELRNDEYRFKKVLFIIIEGLITDKYQGWSHAVTVNGVKGFWKFCITGHWAEMRVREPVCPLNMPVQSRLFFKHSFYLPTCDIQGWKNHDVLEKREFIDNKS